MQGGPGPARDPAVPDASGSVEEVRRYYNLRGESEWHRLAAPFDGQVEWELHRRAFARWLRPGSRVLDIGGGPGRWAIWLAEQGHRVVLADLSAAQLEIAHRELANTGAALEGVVRADARDLSDFPAGSFDAVLCLGPLYHLVDASDRARCRSELVRVLRPGGRLFATVMCRYAWMLGVLFESGSERLPDVRLLLEEGVYRNPAPGRFTEAYLFQPSGVSRFFAEAGLTELHLMASQGMLAPFLEQVAELGERDPRAWEALIEIAYQTAADPSILGLAGHLLYIGERPA